MLDYIQFEEKLKEKKYDNCYVFCGVDEALMKESIKRITDNIIDKSFRDLNYVQFDGLTVDMEAVVNTCETVSFFGDKKVIVVYRANFLGDGEDRENSKRFERLMKYLENPAQHSILIIYYVFQDDREKPSSKIKKLEKKTCTVKFDKLKGAYLERKVKTLFDERRKDIGRVELKLFCDGLENNMNIIENEVEKLCSYTFGRDISKNDVLKMLPPKTDNDIFDLVDSISQKKVEKALDILNELLYKGEKIPYILYMVERQFSILLQIKIGTEQGKDKDRLAKELKLNPYICEKMIAQCRKFTLSGLKNILSVCLNAEESIKSTSSDNKTELELLILSSISR